MNFLSRLLGFPRAEPPPIALREAISVAVEAEPAPPVSSGVVSMAQVEAEIARLTTSQISPEPRTLLPLSPSAITTRAAPMWAALGTPAFPQAQAAVKATTYPVLPSSGGAFSYDLVTMNAPVNTNIIDRRLFGSEMWQALYGCGIQPQMLPQPLQPPAPKVPLPPLPTRRERKFNLGT